VNKASHRKIICKLDQQQKEKLEHNINGLMFVQWMHVSGNSVESFWKMAWMHEIERGPSIWHHHTTK